ncbi:hypothetical protein [Qipengyuania flava]|uniref:hypothetical protein n=1 Tax=Qipengyuania flava TaxID=192812 RepID=UPI00273E7A7E|nr:hypothetical protein [Qipengyuania flava]
MMGENQAHLRLKLDTDEPVALTDFVANFVGLANQFEKFIVREHPEIKAETEIFIKEVRNGCIEADLLAWVMAPPSVGIGLAGAKWVIDTIDQGQILADFVSGLRKKIRPYFKKGGRTAGATKGDLNDFNKTLRAITRDPNGAAKLEAATFEDGERKVRAEFRFTSQEARSAEAEINDHIAELSLNTDEAPERVLMQFVRPSVEMSKPGKSGGERGVVESIAKRALPVLYASTLAEERLRHEKMQLEGNVFRALFQVSACVERNSSGRAVAYKITDVHAVLPDGADDDLLDG